MAFLPKSLASLVASDPTLARVSSNVRSTLQPTLDFLNTYIGQGADGTLRLLRNTVAQGTLNVLGKVALSGGANIIGTTTINGNVNIFPATGNGVIITPPVPGPAFYVTNIAGTSALFVVADTGAVSSASSMTAANMVSYSGFKSYINAGTVWGTAIAANTYYQTQYVVQSGSTVGQTPFIMKWTHAGSLVGWTVNNAGPNAGTMTLQVFKNGVSVSVVTVGAGGGNATFWGTLAKGAVSFAPGDSMSASLMVSTTGNLQALITLAVEMSA